MGQNWHTLKAFDPTLYGAFSPAQTWNVINGRLILGSVGQDVGSYNSLIYWLFDDNVVYTFSLVPYGINNPTPEEAKDYPLNTGDAQTLQSIIQKFAQSLPGTDLQKS
jgi:hypothetical protein